MRKLARPLHSTQKYNGNMEGFNGKSDMTWLRLQKECSGCWVEGRLLGKWEEGRIVKRLVVTLTGALVVGVVRDD